MIRAEVRIFDDDDLSTIEQKPKVFEPYTIEYDGIQRIYKFRFDYLKLDTEKLYKEGLW